MKNPDCFGVYWEAVPGSAGDNCRRCILKDDCLAEFATTTLPAVQQRWTGAGNPLAWLASELDVAEQAVLLAMGYVEKPKKPKQTPITADMTEKPKGEETPKSGKNKEEKKKRSRQWGKETHAARWSAERDRHPAIAQLTPGTEIRARFKGKPVSATVKKGGYDYEDLTFPTLSTLTKHITNSSRNSVKFWGLTVES
jgi:hypothetical protein